MHYDLSFIKRSDDDPSTIESHAPPQHEGRSLEQLLRYELDRYHGAALIDQERCGQREKVGVRQWSINKLD